MATGKCDHCGAPVRALDAYELVQLIKEHVPLAIAKTPRRKLRVRLILDGRHRAFDLAIQDSEKDGFTSWYVELPRLDLSKNAAVQLLIEEVR